MFVHKPKIFRYSNDKPVIFIWKKLEQENLNILSQKKEKKDSVITKIAD